MNDSDLGSRLLRGALAGVAGTFALQPLRSASQKYLPSTMPPVRKEPGQEMVERAEAALPDGARERIPDAAETAAATGLSLGYGATAGALYGAFASHGGDVLLGGTALGVATWAAGYLGWIPAMELMPPVTEHEPAQIAGPVVRHALYGIATAAAYHLLSDWVS